MNVANVKKFIEKLQIQLEDTRVELEDALLQLKDARLGEDLWQGHISFLQQDNEEIRHELFECKKQLLEALQQLKKPKVISMGNVARRSHTH